MRYLSLFSGIEAASAAWEPLGWEAAAFAEIEPFPCAVLEKRWPDVPNLGDVTKITDEQIAALGKIDLVVGGSPCQDLSVAGKRAGLSGERSGLFHELVRIFHAARSFCGARFLLWENVPGAFGSHRGRDFALVAGTLAGCRIDVPENGWGTEGVALGEHGLLEWAVLDAQWFGVAQRRRRVFALLDAGDWRNRPPILLESDRLRGDSPPRETAREDAAGTAEDGAGGVRGDLSYCFDARGNGDGRTAATISGDHESRITDDTTCVVQPLTRMRRGRDKTHGLEYRRDGTASALITPNGGRGGIGVGAVACVADAHPLTVGAVTRKWAKGTGGWSGDECQNLIVVHGSQDPEFFRDAAHPFGRNNGQENVILTRRSESVPETASTLTGSYGTAINNTAPNIIVHPQDVARRLTPRECERLMGFPDGYTRIEWRGKPAADTPRYKALGNSMAVPVMRWIGQKIDDALVYQATASELQRKLTDCLCAAYRKGTGLEPGREPSNQTVIGAVARLLPPDAIPQLEAFLTDKPYLFDRIRERSGRRRFFRQPAVLLAYFLADRMPSQTRDLWPIESKELAMVFSDLGVRFPSRT